MSLKLSVNMQITGTETLTGEFVDPNNSTVTINGLNSTTELTGSTVPPVTKQSAGRATLVAGVFTIDLTSLPDGNGNAGAVTFNGLKVNAYKLINPSANANAITVTFGAATPYLLHGAAFKFILNPGEELQWKGAALGVTVDPTHKNIDVSGVGTQYLEFHLAAGI